MREALAFLVRLFPKAFRDQFGEDLVEQVRADYDRAASGGRLRAAGHGLAAALDLVRSALGERLDPAWAGARAPSTSAEGMGTMSGWAQDLRLAVRSLRRSKGFTAVTVGTLGLAIGANAGIFSVVDAVLLNPFPYPEADRLVYIAGSAPGSDLPEEFGLSAEFYVEYAEESELLDEVTLFSTFTATLRVADRAERVRFAASTERVFQTLGVQPILGRLPVAEDEDGVAVISHGLWVTWFGADPAVLGRSYDMIGAPRTVIGVMGPDFWFPDDRVVAWVPQVIHPETLTPGRFGQGLVARLAPGAEAEALPAELARLARRLPERFGGTPDYARVIERFRPIVRPLDEAIVGEVARPLWILLAAVAIVLLIACANVGNLFMVRAERRQRDLAVRRAIGAARGQLLRSQMAETVVVAALGGALAVALAWVGVPLFVRAAPSQVPRLAEVAVDGSVVLFTLAASVAAALLCGLLPAIRSSSPSLTRLRDGSRGSTSRRHPGRDGLVVAQTALALVLLIASGLLVRSFEALRSVDPGYDTADVFTFQIAPEAAHLVDGPSFARFHMDFMARLAALPGVASVGLVENVPLDESLSAGRFRTEATAADPGGGTLLWRTFAAGDYFRTMGIDVLRGRAFADDDHVSTPGNVVVSRSAAELLWPGQQPVGQRLRRQDAETWETVVGVVDDVMQEGFREPPVPMVYFPLVGPTPTSWVLSSPAYVLKTERADVIAPEVRELVREVAPGAPMYRVYTMEGLAADSMVQLSFTMLTLGIASALALLLGTVGLYGVLSYGVAERTQEIGVRMALGAEASGVQRMVVAQGARVVLVGVALGTLAAVASTRALGSLLFGVGAADPATFVGMALTMTLVGLLASYLPARRASTVDPIRSLRGE